MSEEMKPAPGGMKPWLRVLLVVSLAMNLLVVGALIGALVTWSNWRSHHPSRLAMAGGPLTRALAPEDRRAIGKEMRKAHRKEKGNRARHHGELMGLVADLKAEPFDPEAVEQRLARHRKSFDDRLGLGLELLTARLTQMTAEDRAAYADRLQDVLTRRGKGKKDKSDKD
ncbi:MULTISPECIES: periplasmic heavy metal sensor [unclassified Roseovarius]|uniref:periplasmic heavy metal sensor n=1 Tax=unclassified Roseovarius TaxID=2614913 RepID=UPI00273F8108|nr:MULTISPECIES: periplasmic heavy metal sensor [unclassified Roseovarius]